MRYRDGSNIKGLTLSEDDQPVVFVSYCDALGFCYWLNKNTNVPDGFRARLPEKTEWDYFIKPNNDQTQSESLYREGNFLDESANKALGWGWHLKNYDDGFPVSAPVNLTFKNELGIFGLSGNVREWTNEQGKNSNWHIIRGASWRDSDPNHLRWDYRVEGANWGKDNHIGFRVVIAKENSLGN